MSLSAKVGKSSGSIPANTTQEFTIKPASGEIWDIVRVYAEFEGSGTVTCQLKLILTNGTDEITVKSASGTGQLTITYVKGDTDYPNLVIDNTWYLIIRITNNDDAEKSYEYHYVGVGLS